MTLILRPIHPADNPALAKIVVSVLAEFGISGEGFACNDPELTSLSTVYQDDDSAYWVAQESTTGEILGGGGFTRLKGTSVEEGICELQKYYFLPPARGQGLGKVLLEKTIEAAREKGYQYMYLETTPMMQQALKLYENNGFTYLEGPMGATGHSGCTVWMGKSLVPVLEPIA
jgi:putative acetyltransferase